MKKVLIIGCILFLCIAACAAGLIGAYIYIRNNTPTVQAKLVVEDGTAQLKHNGNASEISDNADLFTGDEIITDAESTATVLFVNNSVTRMNHDTDLVITNVSGDAATIDLQVLTGQIWNRVQKVISGGEFKVEGNGVIAAVRGTVFDFNTADESERTARVSVVKGTVGVSDKLQFNQNISEGKFADLSKTGEAIIDEIANAPLDTDWASWNQVRDDIIDNFLKNHQHLFDALEELYPGKFQAAGGLAGSLLQGLPFSNVGTWSESASKQICSSYPEAQQAQQALRSAGDMFLGAKTQVYLNALGAYLGYCQDGVMTRAEFTEFAAVVKTLQ